MNPLMYRHPQQSHFSMVPYLHGPIPHRSPPEEDLATVALQIQRKRFYVDVKKNHRGIYMKIAEVSADGRKARILLTIAAAFELKEKLKDLITVMEETLKDSETSPENADKDSSDDIQKSADVSNTNVLIKSYIVNSSSRRYFLDLKRNRRGLFLRITMLSSITRIQLAVPAQGMVDLYTAISDLLEKWAGESKVDEKLGIVLPESKSMRVDNRTLYFDTSLNQYGTYLRISEVRPTSRTAITIPERSISRFRDIINGIAEELNSIKVNLEENNDIQKIEEPNEEPTKSEDASE